VNDLVVLSPRIPYRTHARLRLAGRIDRLAAGLVERGHVRTAEWMWRACRML
jgi:hypothetical protein